MNGTDRTEYRDLKDYLSDGIREWDIVGTTDLSVPSMAIKRETWGQFYKEPWNRIIFRQDLCSSYSNSM